MSSSSKQSSGSTNANTSGNASNTSKASASNTQAGKGAGSHGGSGVSKEFTESYGLKWHDQSGYKEAKAIQQAFRDQDNKQGR